MTILCICGIERWFTLVFGMHLRRSAGVRVVYSEVSGAVVGPRGAGCVVASMHSVRA